MSRVEGVTASKKLPKPLSHYMADLPAHSWKIGPELAAEIAGDILSEGRRNVLEFGAGASSVVAAMRWRQADVDRAGSRLVWSPVGARTGARCG